MKQIDFSSKHNIFLQDEDGNIVPMDEPYFRAKLVTPGTWRILSDGDYSYMIEGDDEAFMIDSGYGAGNIREFCQTLTEKPLRRIANTHHHFDHTANNTYFECAYMSPETQPLASIPFPSFDGVMFPRDYPVVIVDEGDIIPLKGHDLEVFRISDHTDGGLAFLDRKSRILFVGDELGMPMGKPLNGSVERWARYMENLLTHRNEFDILCGGAGINDACLIEKNLENARYILAGHEGKLEPPHPFPDFSTIDSKGRTIWKRRFPHPGDGPKDWSADQEFKRTMEYSNYKIIYDIRKIYE